MMSRAPLLSVLMGLSTGIFLEDWVGYIHFPFGPAAVMQVFILVLLFYFWRQPKIRLFLLCLASIIGGAVHLHAAQTFAADHFYFSRFDYLGLEIQIEGEVSSGLKQSQTLRGEKTSFDLSVRNICCNSSCRNHSGVIRVSRYGNSDVAMGDRIILKGKLRKPYNFSSGQRFSYRRYLARKGIFYTMTIRKGHKMRIISTGHQSRLLKTAGVIRSSLSLKLSRYLSVSEAGLTSALLWGERQGIPDWIQELYRRTGTSHVLAISGLHVGLVVSVIYLVLKILPMTLRWRYLATLIFLGLYVILAGGRASVIRAALMAAVFITGFLIERESEGINSLSAAGCLILLAYPSALFAIGFQLSVVSVFCIVLVFGRAVRLWPKKLNATNRWKRYFWQSCAVSVSAWLGSAGLIAWHFGVVTPVGLLANLAVVPFISAIVALGFGLLASAYLCPFAAPYFAVCLSACLNGMTWVIYGFSLIPAGVMKVPLFPVWVVVLYYILLTAALFWLDRRASQKPVRQSFPV